MDDSFSLTLASSLAFSYATGLVSFRCFLHLSCLCLRSLRISSNPNFIGYELSLPKHRRGTIMNNLIGNGAGCLCIGLSAIGASHLSLRVYAGCSSHYQRSGLVGSSSALPFSAEITDDNGGLLHWNNHRFNSFVFVSSLPFFLGLRGYSVGWKNLLKEASLFRCIAPSDGWSAGSFAAQCISGDSVKKGRYVSKSQQKWIHQLGLKYGCHHCGDCRMWSTIIQWRLLNPFIRRLKVFSPFPCSFIGDHIPPSHLCKDTAIQKLFPQCRNCSQIQAASVRIGKRTLIVHRFFHGTRLWHFYVPFPVLYLCFSGVFPGMKLREVLI